LYVRIGDDRERREATLIVLALHVDLGSLEATGVVHTMGDVPD
jgi:hypothetical protein